MPKCIGKLDTLITSAGKHHILVALNKKEHRFKYSYLEIEINPPTIKQENL
jgi:hypothetical protein